jgi:SMC interacting uncharacterized protein involved in chromosome segregation
LCKGQPAEIFVAMSLLTRRSNFAPVTVIARQSLDPSLRRLTYGPIQPMDSDRPWWERIFRR